MSTTRKINWDDYKLPKRMTTEEFNKEYMCDFSNTASKDDRFVRPIGLLGDHAMVHQAREGEASDPRLSFDEQPRIVLQDVRNEATPCKTWCQHCLKVCKRECG